MKVADGRLSGQDGEASNAILLSFGADTPSMDYMLYLNQESGLPERIVYVNRGFTVEIGKLGIPAKVATDSG